MRHPKYIYRESPQYLARCPGPGLRTTIATSTIPEPGSCTGPRLLASI